MLRTRLAKYRTLRIAKHLGDEVLLWLSFPVYVVVILALLPFAIWKDMHDKDLYEHHPNNWDHS